MIVCPSCKEEIDDDSHFCDQCGQALAYCERCGRVGIGRRCTSCGGLMLSPEDYKKRKESESASQSAGFVSQGFVPRTNVNGMDNTLPNGVMRGIPQLMLYNDSLGIRLMGINGAMIGRKQGPYVQQLGQQMYVSGAHAQLKYNGTTGWSITDKHSSNGTKLNDHQLQPDVEMSLKNGDILCLANVVLKVSIK